MGELIFIIFTILIVIGFLVYHYLNRDSSATLSDDYSQARKMSYGGISPRYWRSLDASFIEKNSMYLKEQEIKEPIIIQAMQKFKEVSLELKVKYTEISKLIINLN